MSQPRSAKSVDYCTERSKRATRIICAIVAQPLSPRTSVFKLFRTKQSLPPTDIRNAPTSELRGTTLEGYHFAIRVERNAHGQALGLIGWFGSSQGGGRVELRREADGLWRDVQGRQAASVDDLLPPSVRRSAAWAAQWCEALPVDAMAEPAASASSAQPQAQES